MAVRREAEGAGAPARAAAGGLLAAGLSRLSQAIDDVAGELVLWWPVGFAVGLVGYFGLSDEPDIRIVLAVLALALGLALALRRAVPLARAGAFAVLAVTAGLAAGTLRTLAVAAPVLEERMRPLAIEGIVEAAAARGAARIALDIAPTRIGRLEPSQFPARIRVTVSARLAGEVEAGDAVAMRAVLMPPPGPVAPGAYDFARDAWFDRIGAVGYALSRVTVSGRPERSILRHAAVAVERMRSRLDAHIRARVPSEEGAIASALLTGKRGAIAEANLASLRDSGLAHLLAISGLHMALVCGSVFGAATLVLALVPWVALRITAAKWAAGFALVAGFGYFIISGGSVSTERAFIMAAIAFAAVMLDRPAITMRNVAVAASVTLALRPESINEAGMQMSFGAVIALVAFYDAARSWRRGRTRQHGGRSSQARRILLGAAAVAATTMVASIATGPIAAHHFNRVAVYGLAANMVAVPLASLAVMPLGLIAMAALPLGLDGPMLELMALAISAILAVSDEVVSWPGAVRLVAAAPPASLALFMAGGLWLCLWRGRARLAGLVPIALSAALSAGHVGPDMLIAREGSNIALRGPSGLLSIADSRTAGYSAEQWLRRDGDTRRQGAASPGHLVCDGFACTGQAPAGLVVSYVRRRDALNEDCDRVNILVAAIPVGPDCAAHVVIDLIDLRQRGAHALKISPDGTVHVIDAQTYRGRRPWAGAG